MLSADDSELMSLLDREELVDNRRDSKSSSSNMKTCKISFDQNSETTSMGGSDTLTYGNFRSGRNFKFNYMQ